MAYETIVLKYASDGSYITVVPLMFGRARITYSRPGPMQRIEVDDVW